MLLYTRAIVSPHRHSHPHSIDPNPHWAPATSMQSHPTQPDYNYNNGNNTAYTHASSPFASNSNGVVVASAASSSSAFAISAKRKRTRESDHDDTGYEEQMMEEEAMQPATLQSSSSSARFSVAPSYTSDSDSVRPIKMARHMMDHPHADENHFALRFADEAAAAAAAAAAASVAVSSTPSLSSSHCFDVDSSISPSPYLASSLLRLNLKRTGQPIGSIHEYLRPSKRIQMDGANGDTIIFDDGPPHTHSSSSASPSTPFAIHQLSLRSTTLQDKNRLLAQLHEERMERRKQQDWLKAQAAYEAHTSPNGNIDGASPSPPSPRHSSQPFERFDPDTRMRLSATQPPASFIFRSSPPTSSIPSAMPPTSQMCLARSSSNASAASGATLSVPLPSSRLPMSPLARFSSPGRRSHSPLATYSLRHSHHTPAILPNETSWAAERHQQSEQQIFETMPWIPQQQQASNNSQQTPPAQETSRTVANPHVPNTTVTLHTPQPAVRTNSSDMNDD